MFNDVFYEKKELKRYSVVVGCVLLLSYFVEQILSNILVVTYSIFGYTSSEINAMFSNPWSGFLYNTLILSAICVFPFCLLKFVNKQPIYQVAKFNSPLKNNVLLCIGFAFGFSMIANIATSLFNMFLSTFFDFQAVTSSLGSNTSGDIVEFIYILICSAVVPALVEEFAFRGMILGTLRKFGDVPAIILSSLVFALFHGNFVQIPFALIVGIVLGLITVITNSIWPAIISHFLINAYANVVNLFVTDYTTIVATLLYLIVVIGIVCLVILLKKGAFKSIDNKIVFMPIKSKILNMIFAPTTVVFMIIMIYRALQYKV